MTTNILFIDDDAAPDTVRLMLTGNADQKTAVDAVNDGHVFRFLTKPCAPAALAAALEAALKQYRLITAERELLHNTLAGSVQVLMDILSVNDPETFRRSTRLKEYMQAFDQSASRANSWELELAAMLSQIGRVTVPASLLAKERAQQTLSGPEQDVLNRIPEVGACLLEKIPRLDGVAAIVRYQRKHFDGTGFPAGPVAGVEIPIGARLLKVLGDMIDLESRSVSKPVALQRMHERTGWYAPAVLAATSRCFDLWVELAPPAAVPSRQVRLKELGPGQILAQEIRTRDGSLLVPAQTKLSPTVIEKLHNFRMLEAIEDAFWVRDK